MTADPIAGIIYPTRSVAPNITSTMQPTIDAIGADLGDLWTGKLNRTREIAVTISGTLGAALDLAAAQTVAASRFGTAAYNLRVNASISASAPAGMGLQLDIMLDGVVKGTFKVTNSGTSANTVTAAVNRTVAITDALSHIVRAVVTPLGGTVTIAADTTRIFEIQASPYQAL